MPTEEGVSPDAMARQADADFGLFGGSGAGDDAQQALDDAGGDPAGGDQGDPQNDNAGDGEQDPAAGDTGAVDETNTEDAPGTKPAGLYDPAFFKL